MRKYIAFILITISVQVFLGEPKSEQKNFFLKPVSEPTEVKDSELTNFFLKPIGEPIEVEDSEFSSYFLKPIGEPTEVKDYDFNMLFLLNDSDEKEADLNDSDNLDQYLSTLNREQLIEICLNAEFRYRRNNNIILLGGLHDYIDRLENSEIISIIKDYASKDKSVVLRQTKKRDVLTETQFIDYLNQKSKEILIRFALACELHEREVSGKFNIGGLHDYVFNLEKSEIIKIISNYGNKFPELRENELLELISIRNKKVITDIINSSKISTFVGLDDYLSTFDLDDLRIIAVACENYDRKIMKVFLIGGLHDYIETLNFSQVVKIILGYADKYEELGTPGFLEKLASLPVGGYNGLLQNKSLDQVKSICLKLEIYDRKKKNIKILGGLHDYIDTLTRAHLVNYIRKQIEKNPELLVLPNFYAATN